MIKPYISCYRAVDGKFNSMPCLFFSKHTFTLTFRGKKFLRSPSLII